MSAGAVEAGRGRRRSVCRIGATLPSGRPWHLLLWLRRPLSQPAPDWRPASAAWSPICPGGWVGVAGSVVGGRAILAVDPDALQAPGGRPPGGSGVGHQRQDHHDQPAPGRPGDRRPGGHQRPRRQPAARPGRRPGGRRAGRGRGPGGRRGLAGTGRGRHRAPGRGAAQPEPRPARSQQRGPPAGRHLAAHLGRRRADTVVVANADDPLVVWGAGEAARVRWVGAGQPWTLDAAGCPRCGGRIRFGGGR